MKILALEFSTSQRSAAVVVDERVRATARETGGRAAHAFELIERALRETGLEREQIECVAVGLGPGSYTGIRAAIAVAQGWQLGRPSVKLLGISSVESLAWQAEEQGWIGKLNVVIDAQRGEFYLARYELSPDGRKEIAPLKLATREEVAALSSSGELIAGPEVEQWFAGGRTLFPDAATVGRLAAAGKADLSGEKIEPIYLREISFVKAPPSRILPKM